MAQYWILVADSARARLFARSKKFGQIEEIETLVHPESRLLRQDLASDRPGQVQESRTPGESANEAPTDPKVAEAQQFARELARHLREGRVAGQFGHLVLVADPKFLGMIRKSLDHDTRSRIAAEVSKNVVRESTEAITRAVDAAL